MIPHVLVLEAHLILDEVERRLCGVQHREVVPHMVLGKVAGPYARTQFELALNRFQVSNQGAQQR